jgi:hypothetical protein
VFLAPLTGELFTLSSPLRFPKLNIKPSSWDSTFLGPRPCKLIYHWGPEIVACLTIEFPRVQDHGRSPLFCFPKRQKAIFFFLPGSS